MNKLLMYGTLLSFSVATLFMGRRLMASADCMDNSWHLTQKNDAKEYHLVECNHDCYHDRNTKILEDRGKCIVCGHYHIPRPFIIIPADGSAKSDLTGLDRSARKSDLLSKVARAYRRGASAG